MVGRCVGVKVSKCGSKQLFFTGSQEMPLLVELKSQIAGQTSKPESCSLGEGAAGVAPGQFKRKNGEMLARDPLHIVRERVGALDHFGMQAIRGRQRLAE